MPYRDGDPTVEFEAKVEHTTEKAFLIEPTMAAQKQVWLPKSQIAEYGEPDENGMRYFRVTKWWYDKAGLGFEPNEPPDGDA